MGTDHAPSGSRRAVTAPITRHPRCNARWQYSISNSSPARASTSLLWIMVVAESESKSTATNDGRPMTADVR
jgi:hypothetical protein